MSDLDQRIGKNVRALRETRGLSQADVSTALTEKGLEGIYPQTIAKIESGLRTLKFVEALMLAEVLQLNVHRLADLGVDRQLKMVQDLNPAASARTVAVARLLDYLRARTTAASVVTRHPEPDLRDAGKGFRALAERVLSSEGDPEQLIEEAYELWDPGSGMPDDRDWEQEIRDTIVRAWATLQELWGEDDGEHPQTS